MSIFKKYKLWWLTSSAVFWFMTANAVMFALTGMSLITPNNKEQGLVAFFVFVLSGAASGFAMTVEANERSKP